MSSYLVFCRRRSSWSFNDSPQRFKNNSEITLTDDSCCQMYCHWLICLSDACASQMMIAWLSRFNYWVVLDLAVLQGVCWHVCLLMSLSGTHCGSCVLEPGWSEQSQGGWGAVRRMAPRWHRDGFLASSCRTSQYFFFLVSLPETKFCNFAFIIIFMFSYLFVLFI